jgi:uncharacterized protein DUF3465
MYSVFMRLPLDVPNRILAGFAAWLLSLACVACGSTTAGAAGECNNAGFLATQHAHANHAEVTFCGTVVRLRPAMHTRSGRHRYIFVDVGHDNRIEIDANLDQMGNFPVTVGEHAEVRGEYYYDNNGREGVHWTHHTDRGGHPPGYLILNGTTYS